MRPFPAPVDDNTAERRVCPNDQFRIFVASGFCNRVPEGFNLRDDFTEPGAFEVLFVKGVGWSTDEDLLEQRWLETVWTRQSIVKGLSFGRVNPPFDASIPPKTRQSRQSRIDFGYSP